MARFAVASFEQAFAQRVVCDRVKFPELVRKNVETLVASKLLSLILIAM